MSHRSFPRRLAFVALLLVGTLWGGCADAPSAPAPPVAPTPRVPLQLAGSPDVLVAGARVQYAVATPDPATASMKPVSATWRSTDERVAQVLSTEGTGVTMLAMQPGTTTLSAWTANSDTIRFTLTVVPRPTVPTRLADAPIDVPSFEIMWDSGGTSAWYSPRATLAKRVPGDVQILEMSMHIPGVPVVPACSTLRTLTVETAELFAQSYGDYEVTLVTDVAFRPLGDPVLRLIVRDPSGTTMAIDVGGKVGAYRAGPAAPSRYWDTPWNCPPTAR